MEGGDVEVDIEGNHFPPDWFIVFDIVEVDEVKSRVGYFKEVQEGFSFEEVLGFNSEGVLLE